MRIVDEATLDHVPAEHTLQTTEHKHQHVFRPFSSDDIAFNKEIDKGQCKDDADRAAKQTVQELKPEDPLEGIHIHM